MSKAKQLHSQIKQAVNDGVFQKEFDTDSLIELAGEAVDEYDSLKHSFDETVASNRHLVIAKRSREASNLLELQIKEAFNEILQNPRTNQIHFLNFLQPFVNHGYKETNKEAANY